MLSVSELNVLLEQSVCGVEIFNSLCLASGRTSNITSDDMADHRRQGIAVDDDNNTVPQNIPLP